MKVDVWLVGSDAVDEPDPDRELLDAALRDAGIVSVWADWNDASVDWARGRVCYPRATWDYYRDLPAFLGWAAAADRVTTLRNPLSVIRWNTHKRYLLELAERGVNVVPTRLVERGAAVTVDDVREDEGWERVVIKPAVSCGSWETRVVEAGERGEPHWARLLAQRDMLVQPYIASVDTVGERCAILIDGVVTHVVRKNPRFAGSTESVTGPFECTDAERRLIERALSEVEESLDYARVDIVLDDDGAPMVAELELVEPSLFFPHSPHALEAFVGVIEKHLSL